MESTVSPPISSREIKEEVEVVAAWANKEAIPVLRELREFANAEQVLTTTGVSAGDGAWTTLWVSDPVPTGVAVRVIADVIGKSESEAVCYQRAAFFMNEGGTLDQIDSTEAIWSFESAAGPDVRLQISGQTITLEVQDDGADPFTWNAIVRAFATPRP